MSTVRQIGKNVVTQWVAFGIRAAIGILLVPFLIGSLGRDYYGIAMLLGVIVSFSEVADMGLRTALGRHLSEALAQKDSARFSRLASTAGAFWIAMAGICVLVLFLGAERIVALLGIPKDLASEAVFLLRTFGVGSLFLAFTQPIFSAVITCNNRFDLISRTEVVSTIFSGAALYLLLGPGGQGILAWALVNLSVRLGVLMGFGWISFRLKPDLELHPKKCSWAAFRQLFGFGWQVFFLQLTDLLSMKADPLILTKFLGPQSLALYRPGLMLVGHVRPLVMVLANQLYPVTTRFHAEGKNEELEKVLFVGTRLTFGLAIGAFVLLGVFSQSIARVWLEGSLGIEYRIAGHILLGWALVDLLKGAAGSLWPVLIAKNRIRFIVFTQFPLALLNISASIYFVGYTSLGVIGVIIPTVAIGFILRVVTMLYVNHVFGLSFWSHFRAAHLRPVILLALLLPVSTSLAWFFPARTIWELVPVLGITAALWVVLFFWIVLHQSEKIMLLAEVKKYTNRRLSFTENPVLPGN